MQQPKPARAAQAAPDARAAAETPRVTAQQRLGDAINGGRPVAQLAALGSLINAAVVQRAGDDDDAGASASSSSGPIGSAAASPSTMAGVAPVQAPGAEAQRLLAAMAAMRGQAAAAPNHGAAAAVAAAGNGGAAPDRVSASASSVSMVLSSIAGPEMSGRTASALMRGHASRLLRGPDAPAAVAAAAAAGGAAAPRHSLANLLFSSISPMARHSAERSLYFRDGTRVRLMHPDGPEISQEAMDRRTFVAGPDGSFYSSSHYDVHDNRAAITEPARMGAAGKIFEISDRHIHPSRGWPAREAGIRDEAHLGRVVAAAARATQEIRDAKDRLAEAQALLHANPHEPRLIAARTRAANRLRMRIARGNLAIRIAYGGRRLDPRAPVLPAGNGAAGPRPGPGSGSGGAPAGVSGSSSSSSARRPNVNASAAAGSSSGNSNAPAHAQPQPVPANAAAAAAAAGVDFATAAARDALLLIARAHMATIDARARPGPPAGGGAGGKPPAP